MLASGAVFFLLIEYGNTAIDFIGHLPHQILIWSAWGCMVLGALDAMQVISLFKFKPNKKLLNKIYRRPEEVRKPWE